MPDVSIIIPHYNRPEILEPCLLSLRKCCVNTPSLQIVVVDDGSTDESVSWIRQNFPEVELIRNQKNLGFVGATQAGIDATDAEILVFLNNDTRVEPESLRLLVDPLLSGKLTGAVGCQILDWEGSKATFRGGSVNLLGFGFEDQGKILPPDTPPIQQLFVCGGAMAISRNLYRKSGGFDPEYGSIYEDVDLGWRLNLQGHKCRLLPSSRVFHRAHASFGRESFARKAPLYIGNSLRTVFKNVDSGEQLMRVELAVTLAQAREKVCLLGRTLRKSFWERFGEMFQSRVESTPIIDQLVAEEEKTRSLRAKREKSESLRRFSSKALFEKFVPNPTRGWYYDEEQNRLLKETGYWDFERDTYRHFGYDPR
jgi:GT2 family glycosyltransferase